MTPLEEYPLPAEIRELQERKTAEFLAQGLFTLVVYDKPGTVYQQHAHDATTVVTLAGSAILMVEDDGCPIWELVGPGNITEIADGQQHAAKAGIGGWIYLFSCSPEEARRQGLTD